MSAKITCLYDEGAKEGTPLIGAKGFSVLVEVDGNKVMFDTGGRGKYLMTNLMHLDIPAESIDQLVISHGNKPYVGGINDLLEEREAVLPIMYPRSAEGSKNMLGSKGVYVRPENSNKVVMRATDDWTKISEHLVLSKPMSTNEGEESFLVLVTKKGPVVITACSPSGVVNVMNEVKERFGKYPVAYIGGTDIKKKEKDKAAAIAKEFSDRDCTDLRLNHCTGIEGMMYLRKELGLKSVFDFYVGYDVEYDI
jgi:Metal-dependent hydrolases of the beta-lactamase superfamily II